LITPKIANKVGSSNMEAFDSKKVSKEILVKLFIAKKVSKGSKKS
jgi:hypothetical protein